DRRRAEAPAAVVVRRQREVEAIDLLFEDDGVVEIEPAAAIGHGRPRKEPALGAERSPQLAQIEIAPVVVLGRNGRSRGARGHMLGEPGAYFLPKALLLLGIRDLEVHSPLLESVGEMPARAMRRVQLRG